MKNLLIIGARGWGREILWEFSTHPLYKKELSIKGFLDSDSQALDGLIGTFPPIISSVEDYKIQPDDVFFCAMGDPKWRKHYVEIIEEKGGKFISFISSDAKISLNAAIGNGSYVGNYVIISDNVAIGEQAIIHGFSTLGHDVRLGSFVTVESYSFFGGYAEIGDLTTVHVRSTILRHKKVGSNASIGAASVVIRNVKDGTSVFGNPAKIIE